jgi:hypothetical protein
LISVGLLFGLLVGLTLLVDPRGTLGTDTGAKIATLETMQRDGTARPVVGYWAEEWDPEGIAHPLYQASRNEDGEWVIVTTLPMLQAARPLYDLGGYRLTLLLPILGTLGCAVAARALARRLGDADGTLAFWVVGAGSPLLLYGLDFWEHSLGVAACAGAVALLLDAIGDRPRWWHPVVAGALLGAGATLRTEALVYAVVAVGVAGLVLLRRRQLRQAAVLGAGALAGFALPWLANRWLEASVGGLSRAARAGGAADNVAARLGDRGHQALVTTFGMKGDTNGSILIGLAVVAVVLLAVRAERRGDERMATIALALAALPYVFGAAAGLSFIPGLLTACPLAVLALVRRPTGLARPVLAIALLALPLVWLSSYVGGAGPQWGSRYALTTTVLLATLATIDLLGRHPVVGRGLLALTFGVSLLSVAWLSVRTHSVDQVFTDLQAVDADVLIARNAFLLREGGAATVGKHWLSVGDEDAFTAATEIAERSGARTVAVVEYEAAAPPPEVIPPEWTEIARTTTDLAGTPIGIVTYALPTP